MKKILLILLFFTCLISKAQVTLIPKDTLNLSYRLDTMGRTTNVLNNSPKWNVLDILSAPPGSPLVGDYLVGESATGAFFTHDRTIASWSGSAWSFATANTGDFLNNTDEDDNHDIGTYYKTSTVWLKVTDLKATIGGETGLSNVKIGTRDNKAFSLIQHNSKKVSLLTTGDIQFTPGSTHSITFDSSNIFSVKADDHFFYHTGHEADDTHPAPFLTLKNDTTETFNYDKGAMFSGSAAGAAVVYHNSFTDASNRYLDLGLMDNNFAFSPMLRLHYSQTAGNRIIAYALDSTPNVGYIVQAHGDTLHKTTIRDLADSLHPYLSGSSTTNPLTVDNNGSGDASGFTFDGSAAKTLSYNSIGAVPTTRTINGTALSSNVTLTLASSQFANQGTAGNFLQGNASGNPSWAPPFALTTTGSSGAATFTSGTLNIPQYSGGSGGLAHTYAPYKISGDTIYKRINALSYGFSTSNSESANTAIMTTILTDAIAAGGNWVVHIPAGAYSSKITVPYVASFANWTNIIIEGEGEPVQYFGTAGTLTLLDNNTVIKSSAASGAVISAANSGSNFSFVTVIIKNLAVRTYDNPQVDGIDVQWAVGAELENLQIDNGKYSIQSSAPWNGKAGIITPNIGNAANTIIKNVSINGYYRGIVVNEHTEGSGIKITACNKALDFQAGNQTSHFSRIGTYNNVYNIYVSGIHYFTISNMNIEHTNSVGAWYVTLADIKDSANLGNGSINWRSTLAGAAVGAFDPITKSGGTTIYTYQIGVGIATLTANTFTGDQTISNSGGNSLLNINKSSGGNTAGVVFQTGGVNQSRIGSGNGDLFEGYDYLRTKYFLYYTTANGIGIGGSEAGVSTTAGIFVANTGDVTFDNSKFKWDAASHNLINTGKSLLGGATSFTNVTSGFSTLVEINSGVTTSTATNAASLSLNTDQTGTASATIGAIYFGNKNLGTSNKTLGAIDVLTEGATNSGIMDLYTTDAGTLKNAVSMDHKQNVLFNGAAAPTSAQGVLAIKNGTAPTGNVTNGIALYSDAAELIVRDGAGNTTTLSPHYFGKIPNGSSNKMAWAYYSVRDSNYINVDMYKAVKQIELQSAEIEELKAEIAELKGIIYDKKKPVKLIYKGKIK